MLGLSTVIQLQADLCVKNPDSSFHLKISLFNNALEVSIMLFLYQLTFFY